MRFFLLLSAKWFSTQIISMWHCHANILNRTRDAFNLYSFHFLYRIFFALFILALCNIICTLVIYMSTCNKHIFADDAESSDICEELSKSWHSLLIWMLRWVPIWKIEWNIHAYTLFRWNIIFSCAYMMKQVTYIWKRKNNSRCNNISVSCVAIFFTWFFNLFILTLKIVCCSEFVNTFRTPFFMLGPRKHRILLLNANKKRKKQTNRKKGRAIWLL